MKKLRTLPWLWIMLTISVSLSGQQKLKYSLDVGDEFHYQVFNTKRGKTKPYIEKWLRFRVLKKSASGYELSFVFTRIGVNDNIGEFDSKNYYAQDPKNVQEGNNPFVIHQLALGLPIFFKLSKQGEISDIRYSEALKEAINEKVKGIAGKYSFNLTSFLSIPELNQTLQHIFIGYPDKPRATTWSNKVKQHYRFPATTLNYMLSDTAVNNTITFAGNYTNPDSTLFKVDYINKVIPHKMDTEGNYVTDPKTGLTDAGAMTVEASYDNLVEFADVSHKSTIETAALVHVQRVSSPLVDQITEVSGQVKAPEASAISLYIWDNFPDRELVSAETKLDAEGNFELKFELARDTELVVSVSYPNNKFRRYKLLVSPGDRINLDFDEAGKISYLEEDGKKSAVLRETRIIGENLNTSQTVNQALATVERNLKLKFEVLQGQRRYIKDWVHELISADIYYREQSKLLNYYYEKNDGEVNVEMFNRLFKDLDLLAYPSTRSFEFRWFAFGYLYRKSLIIHGYRENTILKVEEKYALAKMLFKGEQRYYAMAAMAHDAINEGKSDPFEDLLNDYKSEYPNSELAMHLENLRKKKADMSEGSVAPDFRLSTLDGDEISLSDYKGKWVILSFIDLEYDRYEDAVEHLNTIYNNIPKKDIAFLLAFTQENTDSTSAFLKKYPLDVVTLDNHGWKEPSTLPYDVEIIEPYYLISPEGVIEHRGNVEPWDLFIEMYTEYIRNDIEQRAQITPEKTPLPTWVILTIVASILAVICAWLLFRLKSVRLQRRQQAKLERVEMEIKAVRSQLNPHFLFNAMNSIQHLVNTDQVEKANLSMAKFAGLMRKVLNQSDQQMQSLQQEIETLKDYLELEALRHGFDFSVDIDEEVDVHNTDIPPMLLQPFVENAVIHGISHIKETGKIDIAIGLSGNDSIFIRIIDNGQGLNGQPNPQSNGKGLELTRKRINLFMEKFKNEISFMLKDRAEYDGQRGAFAEIIVGLER